MWTVGGALFALMMAALAAMAGARSGSAWAQSYGMTTRSHYRFALLSVAFCIALFLNRTNAVGFALLAIYALCAVFYVSSFARGFSEDH